MANHDEGRGSLSPFLPPVPPIDDRYRPTATRTTLRKHLPPSGDAHHPSTIRTAHQRHVRPFHDASPPSQTTSQEPNPYITDDGSVRQPNAESPTPISRTTRRLPAAMSNDTRSSTPEPNDMEKKPNARMSNDTRARTQHRCFEQYEGVANPTRQFERHEGMGKRNNEEGEIPCRPGSQR